MPHNFDVFMSLFLECLAILCALLITVLLVIMMSLGRRPNLMSRRQRFDVIWPLLLIWPLVVSWAILPFVPRPPGWVHFTFDCIEMVVCGVLFWNLRRKFKEMPLERQAAFRQLFVDGFVKPKQIPLTRGWMRMMLTVLTGHAKTNGEGEHGNS